MAPALDDLAALVALIDALDGQQPLDPAALRPIRNAIDRAHADLNGHLTAARAGAHAAISWPAPIPPLAHGEETAQ